MTDFSPFTFKTEERLGALKHRRTSDLEEETSLSGRQGGGTHFKAREMPKYKFFEVRHDSHKKILFQEFSLNTEKRLSQTRHKRSNSQDE